MNRIGSILIALLFGVLPLYSQIVTIPDAAFLHALIEEGVDTNGDGLISAEEAELITHLDVSGNWDDGKPGEIKNLRGISAFLNLDTLRCNYNQLSSLDLSANTSLTFLRCNENQLISLDVSACNALAKLDCERNQLSSLDLSNSHSLAWLSCKMNRLSSLDVSNHTSLLHLRCRMNQISSLDVSGCFALTELEFERNLITGLNLSDNTALEQLGCSKNQLTTLDISSNTALKKIDLRDNPNLQEVCVWTMPFPPEDMTISIEGSPNINFTNECNTDRRTL